ncbi:MAG: sce7726 family protein [Dehalococcoidales bacterium]|nr:sce7726 family protein [Dehalococcoidales bacterium]
MREIDIRKSLNHEVLDFFPQDNSAIVINEFGVCQGEARIDVAVINGQIHGFEIKSENDTLERLPSQQQAYNRVFNTITIVVGDKFIDIIENHIPDWWGVVHAYQLANSVKFETKREYQDNPTVDPYSLAQLLWHREALEILQHFNLDKGIRSKPRRYSWLALANNIPLDQLSRVVRDALKKRNSLNAIMP